MMANMLIRLCFVWIPAAVFLTTCAIVQMGWAQTSTLRVEVQVISFDSLATLGIDPNDITPAAGDAGGTDESENTDDPPLKTIWIERVEDEYGNIEIRY